MATNEDHKHRLLEERPSTPSSTIESLMMGGDGTIQEPDWELIETVTSKVTQLPQPQQTLLQLVFYDRYTYNEITEMMGYSSKSHTWYHVRKALAMLEEELLKDETIRRRYDDN